MINWQGKGGKKVNKPTVQCWGIANRSLQHLIGLSFGDWTRSSTFLVVMTSLRFSLHILSVTVAIFCTISFLIKTITKFSNLIGYQQRDLSINWTVAQVMLVIGQYASFCARFCGALC